LFGIKFAVNSAADKLNFKFIAKKAQVHEARTPGASQIKDRRKI
jgi:hypothetical protein